MTTRRPPILLNLNIKFTQEPLFHHEQTQLGYYLNGDTSVFIFDEHIYKESPKRVTVTGSFRNWDKNMDDTNWQLTKIPETPFWSLEILNKNFANIAIRSEFKFRLNYGDWMAPPENAPNNKNGNR